MVAPAKVNIYQNILIVIFSKGNEILPISTREKIQKFPVKDGCIEWNGFKFDWKGQIVLTSDVGKSKNTQHETPSF